MTSEPKLWDNVVDLRPKRQPLLTTSLFIDEAARLYQQSSIIAEAMKLGGLRKSCGVEAKKMSVKVNLPPRYR